MKKYIFSQMNLKTGEWLYAEKEFKKGSLTARKLFLRNMAEEDFPNRKISMSDIQVQDNGGQKCHYSRFLEDTALTLSVASVVYMLVPCLFLKDFAKPIIYSKGFCSKNSCRYCNYYYEGGCSFKEEMEYKEELKEREWERQNLPVSCDDCPYGNGMGGCTLPEGCEHKLTYNEAWNAEWSILNND